MSWELRELGHDAAEPEKRHYGLSGEIIILHVAEQTPALLNVIAPEHRVDVDLSAVTEIDGAGIQLLLFAKQEAERRQCELAFSSHSDPVLDMIDLFNLGRDFGDPVLITSGAKTS